MTGGPFGKTFAPTGEAGAMPTERNSESTALQTLNLGLPTNARGPSPNALLQPRGGNMNSDLMAAIIRAILGPNAAIPDMNTAEGAAFASQVSQSFPTIDPRGSQGGPVGPPVGPSEQVPTGTTGVDESRFRGPFGVGGTTLNPKGPMVRKV